MGFTMSAMIAATMKTSSTTPAARASAQRPRIPSGSATSWTHRGTTSGAGTRGGRPVIGSVMHRTGSQAT